MSVLTSRDNPKVKRWAKLVRDAKLRKKEGRLLVEGPHLVEAALLRPHVDALHGQHVLVAAATAGYHAPSPRLR